MTESTAPRQGILAAPAELRVKLEEVLAAEGIKLALGEEEEADVHVRRTDDRQPCTLETIYAGGWVKCPLAWALAHKLGVSNRALGKILDCLDVKIRECDLGCF